MLSIKWNIKLCCNWHNNCCLIYIYSKLFASNIKSNLFINFVSLLFNYNDIFFIDLEKKMLSILFTSRADVNSPNADRKMIRGSNIQSENRRNRSLTKIINRLPGNSVFILYRSPFVLNSEKIIINVNFMVFWNQEKKITFEGNWCIPSWLYIWNTLPFIQKCTNRRHNYCN